MTSLMKRLLETSKYETVILGPLQRMLMSQTEFGTGRRSDVIHPSELVKPDFCDLAVYYRLTGWEVPPAQHAFQLEVIFSQGHGYHDKWQNWIWDLGMLRGRFRCLACLHGDWSTEPSQEEWHATAPDHCPACGATRLHLQYGEVPIQIPDHWIHGKSDGDLALGGPAEDDPLLEIKSIGEGTVRYEAPKLIRKHTKTVVIDDEEKRWTDWNAVWRDIRRPFMTHLKQGALYCYAMGRAEMIYIYEFKPTGAVKEFRVKHDFGMIEDELETALDLVYAVKNERPPKCPHGGCDQCNAYEELRDGATDGEREEEEEGPQDREGEAAGASEGAAGAGEDRISSRARRRAIRGTGGTRRPLRPGSDGGTPREDGLGELPEREVGRGRADRGGRRVRREARDGEGTPPARGRAPQGNKRDRDEGTRRVVRRRR